ncbi:N-acetylmuramidase family protein [Pseudomonas asiatica]|uniref:N-acetylmuramidase family protein n=1 Tax=Pseudomonas asiatica TaxID=2219225 RepID=A0A9X4I2P6_9PSED|nr:N-acetylmuramidase family protein [Pseudomonas asiatica]MDD2115402.1 N-acetylmuramidase family protein [Pseudomonas asiatica]
MAVSAFKRLIDMFKESEEPEAAKPREAFYPTPDGKPISAASDENLPVVDIQGLQPVKNWSHPFRVKEKSNPLLQLTSLANATAGFFPLGAGGLWHGGVHFDSGTAGVLEQTSVHCLADGEVVAYRTDKHSAKTVYRVNKVPVMKPFSRNFVLVRHRLEPPRIEGSEKKPPSLVFYSLYMHLQDGSAYEEKPTVERPPFWQQKATYVVPMTAKDKNTVSPEAIGLNVRHQVKKGEVMGLLPRGTAVVVSGEGDYRRLENIPGPFHLLSDTRTLLGYVRMDQLELAEDHYRAKVSLSIYAEAVATSKTLGPKLPKGTQVKVSGEGEFRKLEFVAQFVHFKSLQALREPQVFDEVVVLEKPESIRAGDLIGHIGKYQDYTAEHPEEKLHLEIFSGEDVEAFIAECRAWERELPSKERTWLKLVKGTVVVSHQDRFSDKHPPTASSAHALSDANLLVPKVVLDGLPPTHKIVVPASDGDKACNWYRLDVLLNDAANNLLNGWIKEEVGVTPWVSPWAWDGYEVITDYTSPPEFMASFLRSLKRLTDEQLEHYSPMADVGDKGPVKARLLDIVDRDGDNKITAEELRAVIRVPALAQAMSQLIVCYESEWLYKPQKWDGLDGIFGHGGSTPHLNWLAEKERIKQLSWWAEVAGKVGLPKDGKVHHLHPIGLVGKFNYLKKHPEIFIDGVKIELGFLDLYDGTVIEESDYVAAADVLGCEVEAIKAVAITETGSIGSYFARAGDDKVAAILFERHYFHQLTGGRFDGSNPDISSPVRGGYGVHSAQYRKMVKAYRLSASDALKSASWGRFQIMGRYFSNAGYSSVEDFVRDINRSEKNHLKAFVSFIRADSVLSSAIVKKDWLRFALRYNGPAQDGCDEKMRLNYNELKGI